MQAHSPFRVLLIGGSSGVGKTTAARKLSKQFAVPHLLVDDVRIAIHQVTTPGDHPDLHVFLNYTQEQWLDPEQINRDWQAVAQAMIRPLKAVIAHHVVVEGSGPIILEGDGVAPGLGAARSFAELTEFTGLQISQEVRSVFVVETDVNQLLRNLRARGRGFEHASEIAQERFAHASWLYGQWLAQEARALGLPMISSQPFESLAERILTTTGE